MVEAGAAYALLLDEGHASTKLGDADRGDVAGRASANDSEVVDQALHPND